MPSATLVTIALLLSDAFSPLVQNSLIFPPHQAAQIDPPFFFFSQPTQTHSLVALHSPATTPTTTITPLTTLAQRKPSTSTASLAPFHPFPFSFLQIIHLPSPRNSCCSALFQSSPLLGSGAPENSFPSALTLSSPSSRSRTSSLPESSASTFTHASQASKSVLSVLLLLYSRTVEKSSVLLFLKNPTDVICPALTVAHFSSTFSLSFAALLYTSSHSLS